MLIYVCLLINRKSILVANRCGIRSIKHMPCDHLQGNNSPLFTILNDYLLITAQPIRYYSLLNTEAQACAV